MNIPEPEKTLPVADPMDSKSPWTIDDPRMWKEQCRVGDVAFQHLFCISNGKPVPDWVTDRLPKMYSTLEEINRLREELATQKLVYSRLQMACDIFEKNSEGAMLLEQENEKLKIDLQKLKINQGGMGVVIRLRDDRIDELEKEQRQDREEIRKLRAENLKLMDDSTTQYNNLTQKIVDLHAQLKEAKQQATDWEHLAHMWEARNGR